MRPLMRKLPMFALALVAWVSLLAPARDQTLRATPIGFCSLSSLASATKITTTNCVFASFTGVVAGNVLTASAVTGSIIPGQGLVGTSVTTGTFITAAINAPTPGGAGTYQLNNSQTISSESMTTAGVPQTANYMVACAYTQNVNWRDDLTAPTGTVGTGGQQIASGQCLPYNSTFANWQVIQQTASAVVGLTFYLWQ
jgi:hypothetical protein